MQWQKKKIVIRSFCLILIFGIAGAIFSGIEKISEEIDQIEENEFDIQKAINNASAGSTIYVEEGTYREIIHIDKEINLTGEGMPFLNPVSKKNSYAIEIAATGVKLSGFNIRNDGPGPYISGIRILAPRTTIENCNIFNTSVGITAWSSNNTISNCTFWNCNDEAILLISNNNNIIENCVFYNCCDGIELQKSSDNKFINCRFLSNSHAGIDGIKDNNNNNLFSSCVFYNNPFGAYFRNSKNNEFVDCTFLDNGIDNLSLTL